MIKPRQPSGSLAVMQDQEGFEPSSDGQLGTMGWWQRIRQLLWKSNAEKQQEQMTRLTELHTAIHNNPESPSNYVFRGEIYLERKEFQAALEDFSLALKLAQEDVESNRWGIVAQVMQDRALDGLEETRKHL